MNNCYIVMRYDGSQRDRSVQAVFTDESAAERYCGFCQEMAAGSSNSFGVEGHFLDSATDELPGCWVIGLCDDGSVWREPYWSPSPVHTDPPTLSWGWADGYTGYDLNGPKVNVFYGYGSTVESARQSADGLRRQTLESAAR